MPGSWSRLPRRSVPRSDGSRTGLKIIERLRE
jgi:hypothetical protein